MYISKRYCKLFTGLCEHDTTTKNHTPPSTLQILQNNLSMYPGDLASMMDNYMGLILGLLKDTEQICLS